MTGTLAFIHIGLPRTITRTNELGETEKQRTGFYKQPTDQVFVGFDRIDGDGAANLKFHGGVDRPMLFYSARHYPDWQAELNLPEMGPGGFGENFTIDSDPDSRIDETTVCLGDQFRIGESLVVEVSQPREPCSTLTRRWQLPELAGMVTQFARGGWYCRTVNPATVHRGDRVERIANPYPQWTIAEVLRVRARAKKDLEAAAALASVPALSTLWKTQLGKLLPEAV